MVEPLDPRQVPPSVLVEACRAACRFRGLVHYTDDEAFRAWGDTMRAVLTAALPAWDQHQIRTLAVNTPQPVFRRLCLHAAASAEGVPALVTRWLIERLEVEPLPSGMHSCGECGGYGCPVCRPGTEEPGRGHADG